MDVPVKPRIAIAGTGPVARALAKLLIDIDETPAYLVSRTLSTAQMAAGEIANGIEAAGYSNLPSDVSHLLLAVPDAAVAATAACFRKLTSLRVAVHTAGGLPLQALEVLADQGISTAVLHPLQTLPQGGSVSLEGIAFAVWGSGQAAEWATEIVKRIGGRLLNIAPEQQGLYHAAAVMASNQLLALLHSSEHLLGYAGIPPEQARLALHPLVTTSIESSFRTGPTAALTGPIARGDAGTVCSHLLAMAHVPSDIKELYVSASRHLLTMAEQNGLAPEKIATVETALSRKS